MVLQVEAMLEKQGIEQYEKNVSNQLLEFMCFYTTEILNEARDMAIYAGRGDIEVSDLRLAIHSKSFQNFTRPLPFQDVKKIAQERNLKPLPNIDDFQGGISYLPHTEYCQINPNIHIYSEEIESQLKPPLEYVDRQPAVQK